jgi:hypothetical protein
MLLLDLRVWLKFEVNLFPLCYAIPVTLGETQSREKYM